ncbi:DUF5305 domain-containing protein [Natrarchaeobaculum sulfurireducens]|uniref:DUF5305 domain-containing protein n=1 Tax=Natrarchaeobaculum sulfurireducens TaxID=2044521 RepID=A0A346PTT1_9EURY|nr:DUF5305 domain-containing protein [Natrarchaeobaculum sulfurireducens]AXR77108.1 hypothetical protein AArc1_0766 [Natrarchaeobaculum sulfurireducens]AXR82926.1 hypothetical protein AArcMg_2937 [Natrarchaeobaculum sulfurireducens]
MRSTPTDTDDVNGDRERRLRLRTLFWKHRTTIAVALVLVLTLGAWVSYGVYADPGETTEERLEYSWTATGEVDHAAPVVDSTAAYPEKDVLENEPLYYTAISPTAEGAFVGGYDAASGEDVAVSLVVDLHYRAVEPDEGTVYWNERERLTNVNETDVDPGEPVTATFEMNVSAVSDRIDEIETDLEASPGQTEIRLEVDREIGGTIDGTEQLAADSVTVPIEYDGSTYAFDTEGDLDESHESFRTETVAASYGPARSVGGPLLALLGAGGLSGVALASRRVPEPTTAEREWLAYRNDVAEFDEVIVPATLPESVLEKPHAAVPSLAALAELGIDTGEAIVHDRETGRYLVAVDDVAYVYDPPSVPSSRPRRTDDVTAAVPLEFPRAAPSGERTSTDGHDVEERPHDDSDMAGTVAHDDESASVTAGQDVGSSGRPATKTRSTSARRRTEDAEESTGSNSSDGATDRVDDR